MMPAAKHGDPQLGIDVHLCLVPPGTPVPLPSPHLSVVFDPFDYIPILGATVTVCGMKRATAGTNAMVVHIPPGFPFAPKLPDKDDELFMGSATVVADGDPFSYIGLPVLGCQVAGMPSPFRRKKKGGPKAMLLPTTFNLAIPTTVFVGGPPTISLQGLAFKAGFAALGRFAKSKWFKTIRQRVFKKMDSGFLKCVILRAEPVNILTGEVAVEQVDFTLPGRLPIDWPRAYASGGTHRGYCGQGWETPADIRLEVDPADGVVTMVQPSLGALLFDRLPTAEGAPGAALELMDGALLSDHGNEFQVVTKEDRVYCFSKRLVSVRPDGTTAYPIVRITDRCGNWLEFERDGPQPLGIRDSAGRRLAFTIDQGRLTAVTLCDPAGGAGHTFVQYRYDDQGDLIAAVDTLGAPYGFAYDQHRMVRHTDRNGLSFYYEYEQSAAGDWRVTHAWGDGGLYDYRFEYLDPLHERRITDSLGQVSLVKLDARGLPISEIDPLGGMTVFAYDEAGRTTAVTDPAGRRTAYDYDERGNLLRLTRPDGATIATEFNADNRAVAITDPNGAQWRQSWDARGLLVEQVAPLGGVSRYEYDALGQLVALIDARGARTELRFDPLGNLIDLHNALGHHTRFDYDILGNVTARRDPLDHQTLYRYDRKGRLVELRRPSGAVIQCGYDAEDNLTAYIDENGAETRLEYCGQGELKRRLQPDGHRVAYHYDTEERLIGVTNQRGETYQLKRDALGRLVEEVDYWGQARRYTYDPGGYPCTASDPLGRTIAYATDPLGRIVKKHLPDGATETFDYDPNGNLIAAENTHGRIERTFDAEGRLVAETQGGFRIENTYDANGNRLSRQTSLGNTVAYEYDALAQATGIRINQEPPIRIARDAAGRINQETLTHT